MATSTKVSKSAVHVLVAIVGLAAAPTAACSAKSSSCDAINPCPQQPHEDVGVAGDEAEGEAGGCATACASYQFCASDKCLPAYVSTRVLPATDPVNGNARINSAVVLTNEPQGDLVLQLSGELSLFDAAASTPTTLTESGYARYTADGKLVWFRSTKALTGSENVSMQSAIALVSPSDFALSYLEQNASTGPVVPSSSYRFARVNGANGNLTWEAKYPTNTLDGVPLFVVPRPTQGDFLTFHPALAGHVPGEACRVIDNGSWGAVKCSGSSYAIGAVPSADGSIAWIWGAPGQAESEPLNPLSAEKWPFIENPYRFGGEDAFILGIRGASTSVGPWMTEGDYGPGLMLAALPGGDLAVTAQGNDSMTFNGGQSLLERTGSVLFRLDTTTGQIVWRSTLAQTPSAMITAPGGRIAVLNQPSNSAPSVQLFDGVNGALLSTLPVPPTSHHPVLAAGQTDLFVLGDYSSVVDFEPGTGTDQASSSRGVYISRYSF